MLYFVMFCYNLYCFVYYYYYAVSTYVDEDIEQHTIFIKPHRFTSTRLTSILIVCFVDRIDKVDEDREINMIVLPLVDLRR